MTQARADARRDAPQPGRPMSLIAYRAAAGLAAPLAGQLLKARARRGKEDPARIAERLGHASAARPSGPLVWMHAVSVGESISLLPLVAAVAAERPDLAILVTSGTRASAEVLARRLLARAIHQYGPVDTPGAVGRFLAHWRPATGIIVESELWPNLILGARRAGARLALVSARMTERSARAWSAQPSAVRAMLRSFDLVLPQDPATRGRLESFGARIDGQLNLKRVGDPLPFDAEELARLQAMIGARRVVVAASTHAPEEPLVARATAGLGDDVLTLIAPRHPERADEIAQALAAWPLARRSSGQPITPATRIYLADTLGEMGLWLRLADVAVVGNGFPRHGEGHNPLEPARLGVGAISGPHVVNFEDIYAEMAAAGAAVIADDEAALADMLAGLFADRGRLVAMGEAALAFAQAQGDRLSAALGLIRPLLPAAA
ncbi:MAG TPA: 3-deoxy-D-manno-octulosonic acid transferase [Caulobacteraceae bacterium]